MGLIPDTTMVDARCYRELAFPRERVWEWMLTHPCELLAFDSFHARVDPPELPLRKGTRIMIHHEFPIFGYKEDRYARITVLRPYTIGFAEIQDRGFDFFPHSYRFYLAALDDTHTVLGFHVRGRFRIPAARFWWIPWWMRAAPERLEEGLRRVEDAFRRDLAPAA